MARLTAEKLTMQYVRNAPPALKEFTYQFSDGVYGLLGVFNGVIIIPDFRISIPYLPIDKSYVVIVLKCFGEFQSLVVVDDGLGVVSVVETDAAEVVPGLETVDRRAVLAVMAVGGQGERVVREVYVVLVEGFAEEEGVEGPDVQARQVPGLHAPQDRQGAVRPLGHECLDFIKRPAIPHRPA